MQEALFISSPISITLTIFACFLSVMFPASLGQKFSRKLLPAALFQIILIFACWNISNLIGSIFFSGPDYGIGAQITFCIQAMAWIQCGNAIYHICELNFSIRRSKFWKYLNILGVLSTIFVTVIMALIPDLVRGISIFGYRPLESHPNYYLFSLLFMIFVVPCVAASLYHLMRSYLQASDTAIAQLSSYMLGGLSFFFILSFVFDFVLPIAYDFSIQGKPTSFMEWFRYSCLFFALLCGQYFTSITYKNKSHYWFINSLIEQIGDCVIRFNKNGDITKINAATPKVFELPDSVILSKKIQDILPYIDVFKENTFTNIKLQIRDELHTFNVSTFQVHTSLTTTAYIAVLTDQTNFLFYRQRIKALNRQFAEYKQDLNRYQDRLDTSQKKFDENNHFLSTIINALPFQFWSKNEQGVFMTQNQKDINKRGYLYQTGSSDDASELELRTRNEGEPAMFVSYETETNQEITEDEANVKIQNNEPVFIYQNMFYPILSKSAPFKTIGLKIDMTEQRRLEREKNLLQEQKNIHSRLEELGTLCGAFAHDYNNILGSQIGFCQLATEILEDANKKCSAGEIPKSIGTAISFVGEATKAAERGKVSLEELLNTIRGKTSTMPDMMEFAPYMIIDDVKKKMLLTLPTNMVISSDNVDKSIKIKGQPASLDRVLSNLANNAIFAMKEKGGTLTFALQAETLEQQLVTPYAPAIPPGNYAKFTISDTGTGMDSGTLERIFSPFFTTKAPGEGLGLGLSSALRLVKEANAYFTVHTTLGKGTTFNLYWTLENN